MRPSSSVSKGSLFGGGPGPGLAASVQRRVRARQDQSARRWNGLACAGHDATGSERHPEAGGLLRSTHVDSFGCMNSGLLFAL